MNGGAEKEAFPLMQFDAQSRHYHEHYPEAAFRVILSDGRPAGCLYLDRWPDEIRIMDIAPCYRSTGTPGSGPRC